VSQISALCKQRSHRGTEGSIDFRLGVVWLSAAGTVAYPRREDDVISLVEVNMAAAGKDEDATAPSGSETIACMT
jgi:hypothetical protein